MELQPLLLILQPLQRFDPKELVTATLGSNELYADFPIRTNKARPVLTRISVSEQGLYFGTFGVDLPFDESD
jgi:hypothetical protein